MSQNGKSKVELLPEGKQVKHQPVKGSWLSCAIFCKVTFLFLLHLKYKNTRHFYSYFSFTSNQTSTNAWYTPRRELDRLNVDSFFPDGVWCHRDIDPENHIVRNYYCQNNLCLPEVLDSDSDDSDSVNEVQTDFDFETYVRFR